MAERSDEGVSIFDHRLISARYFFPRPDAPPRPFSVETSAGHQLACIYVRPNAEWPTLLHFHGNGEVASDWLPMAEHLASLGINTLLAEYRGYGGSGGHPAMASMLDDTLAIFEAARCAPERAVVYGRSVGSIYAIELASRVPKLAGLIVESGIHKPLERILIRADPEELGVSLQALEAEQGRLFDHDAKLSGYRGSVLIMHALGDSLVGVDNARRNAASSGGALRLFERGDHNSLFALNADVMLEEVKEFVDHAVIR